MLRYRWFNPLGLKIASPVTTKPEMGLRPPRVCLKIQNFADHDQCRPGADGVEGVRVTRVRALTIDLNQALLYLPRDLN